ncbi:hypothetical protein [Streptomyces triculaminicus]|uniref:hypothetical protein n=1 Tax=Streptomyces triculaminicus TaxID=2816232 RepID=UPI0037CDED57
MGAAAVWPPTIRPDPSGYGASDGLPSGNPFVGPGDDRRVCVFMAENQYCNEWGYPAAHAHLADPHVLVSGLDEEHEPVWLLQSHSVSEFLLQLAVTRLPADYGYIVEDNKVDPEVVTRLRAHLRPMGFLPWRELGAHRVLRRPRGHRRLASRPVPGRRDPFRRPDCGRSWKRTRPQAVCA